MGEQVRGTILSGMRPTAGRLHLGNYHGALENWVRLQEEYRCYFAIVDWHALTTGYEDTSALRENVRQLAIDYLAAGIDPERSVVFVQSQVKEHAELHLLLSMIVPLGWLERVPTYKEQLRQIEGREIATYGFLGYPVLQTADIALYGADTVPVGEDQVPHIELAREIVRRFNALYGRGRPVLVEPQALLTEARVLPGIDARKMSKSYGNFISLAASPEEIAEKVPALVTDPARIRKTDPGHPEVCTAFAFHRIYSADRIEEVAEDCRKARIGCVACKRQLAGRIEAAMAPLRERRLALERRPGRIDEILDEGGKKARAVAGERMAAVREAMGLRP